jgi:long-chain acyl-CoA synthetase
MTYLTCLLSKHAGANPDGIALRCEAQELTWSALHEQVENFSAWIVSRTPDGGSVAIDLPTSLDFAVAFLATVHVGRRAVIYDHNWPHAIRSDVENALQIDLSISSDTWPVVDTLQGLPGDFVAPDADTPLMVGFTSGSTGKVKGYERTHGSWISSIVSAQKSFDIRPGDWVCAPGSVSFSLFLYALAHCVYVGAALRLSGHFQPKRILEGMHTDRCTVLLAVPTQAKLLIGTAARSANYDLGALRMIISSGARWGADLSDAHRRVVPNARIFEFYGASELSFVSVAQLYDTVPPGSVGKPFDGVTIEIRAPDGSRCGDGQTGAIWVKSSMLFSRYVVGESPESKWDADFFTVGDHGHLDADGYLYIAGREKRMLVTSGVNLYPEAVEAVISSHDAIEDVSVMGVDEALRGQRVVAFLKLRQNEKKPSSREIAGMCVTELGRHATPSKFYVIDEWPLAESGKTNHQALLEMIGTTSEIQQL